MTPKPTSVRYNDWRQVEVPTPEAFTPAMPVTVVIPYYQTPADVLARTLAALECQTYPRDLFEVVIVDDGSEPPLTRPRSTPLDVRVVHQERRGFGLARARNTGVRAAAHDILLFLDSDILVESDWMAAHTRWHHAVSDAVTLGRFNHVSVDGLDAETVRRRTGSMKELLSDRLVSGRLGDVFMIRRNRPDSRDDNLFQTMIGGNFGVRRDFYWSVGGNDESFTRWGGEDTEFNYRAYTRGGLLVLVPDARAWHQGVWEADRTAKDRSARLQSGKLAHLIAHPAFRGNSPGRIFKVPQYVVTMDAGCGQPDEVVRAVTDILADRVHDLVVRIETPAGEDGRLVRYLQEMFGPDPRVLVGSTRSALDEFPASPFHVTLPAGVVFARGLVHRLRARLGDAVTASSALPEGAAVSITRAWALHRACRTGGSPADFGEARTMPAAALKLKRPGPAGDANGAASTEPAGYPTRWDRLLDKVRDVRSPGEAWAFLKWLVVVVWEKAVNQREIVGWNLRHGIRSWWLRVTWKPGKPTGSRSARNPPRSGASKPPEALRQSLVPAFDSRRYNPFGWPRAAGNEVAALGPIVWLPPGVHAHRVVHWDDRLRLRRCHHVEDVQAFHPDVITRAADLARVAATGVVVHLADGDPRLRALLGAELHDLMANGVNGLDVGGRELLSIRMRRAALRDHSFRARARQLREETPPLVSILMATHRPRYLPRALAAVARQTYPRLELVLALHGGSFAEIEQRVAELPHPVKVVREPASQPLGAVLAAATAAASGTLLAKMDDDDLYGADHVWDLVLAQEYSQAPLVGKGVEFVYLSASDRTVHWHRGGGESYHVPDTLAGGALLISRDELARVGGWRSAPQAVDQALIEDIVQARGCVYRTHGAGFMLVRHGHRHTWDASDDYFLGQADSISPGWNPALADLDGLNLPHPVHGPLRDP